MHSLQVYWLIQFILLFAHGTTCEVQLLRRSWYTPQNPHGLILLDINKHFLELWMCLWHDLKHGMQFWCDLNDKVLGKYHKVAHISGILTQCLQFQQDAALQLLQWLQTMAPTCHGHPNSWLVWVSLQEQGSYTMARYSDFHL